MPRTVEEIELELAEAQRAEDAERKRIRDAVKVNRVYTIRREKPRHDGFDDIFDDTIVAYMLTSTVVNREECEAVGRSSWELQNGGMRYLYNTGTHRLIGATGGGTIYLSLPYFGTQHRRSGAAKLERAVAAISAFLAEYPDGGDISDIIIAFRQAIGDDDDAI